MLTHMANANSRDANLRTPSRSPLAMKSQSAGLFESVLRAKTATLSQNGLAGFGAALRRLTTYAASWAEVEPSAAVRRTALRLLRVHPLRAADALQLAAAIAAAHGDPSTLAFMPGDARLSADADIEGFPHTAGSPHRSGAYRVPRQPFRGK